MAKYLIDANLPYYFGLWNNSDFVHVKDIDDEWNDEQIWTYAKQQNLIIITKDSDFSLKVLFKGAPPKVIHIRIGNKRMSAFHKIISQVWEDVINNIDQYDLINIYEDRVEYVN